VTPSVLSRCECTWAFHFGRPCQGQPVDHGPVQVTPQMCTQCLLMCEAEREEEERPAG
jgi:hypothetical protein